MDLSNPEFPIPEETCTHSQKQVVEKDKYLIWSRCNECGATLIRGYDPKESESL